MKYQLWLKKHTAGDLSDAEWERLAQNLMNVRFDVEKRIDWERRLADQKIVRTQAPALLYTWKRLLAAASLLIAVSVVAWLLVRPAADPAQRLANRYLEQPFRFDQGGIRGSAASDLNRGRALEAFNQGQYENAVQYLQLVEAEGQAKAPDYFQLGLCLMYKHTPDYRSALSAFSAAQRSDPSIYTDEINWFSGLCYLMLSDEVNAVTALRRVVDSPSSRNREAAQELLQAIEK